MPPGLYKGKLYRHMYVLYRVEVKMEPEEVRMWRGKYVNVYIKELGIRLEKRRVMKQTGLNRVFVVVPRHIAEKLNVKTPMDVTVEFEMA